MPIVVDPGFAWPPETDPVVSPDGKITAIVDPAHAGVILRADFDDSVPDNPAVPEKVLRRNLVANPSFEGGRLDDWLSSSSTLTASTGYYREGVVGEHQALWVVSEPGLSPNARMAANMPVEAGKAFGVAVNLGRSTGAEYARLGIRWASGNEYHSLTTGDWFKLSSIRLDRFVLTSMVPPGADNARLYIYPASNASGGNPPAGRTLIDAATAVLGNTEAEVRDAVSSYFDGSTATSGTKRYRWTGAPHASVSEEFAPATPFIPGKPGTVAKVRFERQDGSVVRSGNPAWAPGGYAHAYDHEATLGGGTLWRAVPIRFDGTEGEPSEYVGAVIPALTDGWAWLKPVTDPDKAMLLKVEPPDLSYDGRVDTTSIAGAPRPAATWDVLEGFTTQLRSLVREKNVEEQLMALLDEGPVLAQFPACAGLPDFYFIRGKLDLEHVHWDGWPWRRYQWDVIQIDRPDTTDSPLRIPGLSYDTVARDWTTYDQLKSTVESYNKLLEP